MGSGERRRACAAFFSVAVCLFASSAEATWSIVAVDPETREVGIAGASCILGADIIARLVPGTGAVAAQAIPNFAGRDALAGRIANGERPGEALAAVTASGFDHTLLVPTAQLRQYGVVVLGGDDNATNFTGGWTVGWAGARSAPNVSVQGNMLQGAAVVDDALAAFQKSTPGCTRSLADRLVDALEAGAAAGGDRRCSPDLTALSAFVVVAKPEDFASRPSMSILRSRPGALPNPWGDFRRSVMISEEHGTREENPVLLLRAAFEAARGSAPRCR